jgi:hypothetical protein
MRRALLTLAILAAILLAGCGSADIPDPNSLNVEASIVDQNYPFLFPWCEWWPKYPLLRCNDENFRYIGNGRLVLAPVP